MWPICEQPSITTAVCIKYYALGVFSSWRQHCIFIYWYRQYKLVWVNIEIHRHTFEAIWHRYFQLTEQRDSCDYLRKTVCLPHSDHKRLAPAYFSISTSDDIFDCLYSPWFRAPVVLDGGLGLPGWGALVFLSQLGGLRVPGCRALDPLSQDGGLQAPGCPFGDSPHPDRRGQASPGV